MSFGFFTFFDFTGLPVGQGFASKVAGMLNELLLSGITDLQNLNLQFNSSSIPVVRRKGVKVQPGVDPNPQITICKSPNFPIKIERIGFGKTSVIYPIEIALVFPNPRDWVTNLNVYSDVLDQLIVLFVPPSLTGTNLWKTTATGAGGKNKVYDVRMSIGEFLEPSDMAEFFDIVAMDLEVSTTIIA